MKIAILSRGPRLYSTKRLRQACKDRGHDVKVLNSMDFSIDVEKGYPDLIYKNRRLPNYDAVIPRIGASITFFGTSIVRQFEQMGVCCLNSSLGITASRDKLFSIQLLARHNLGIPHTLFVRNRDAIVPGIEKTAI